MPDALPEPLLAYFAAREAARAEAVVAFLSKLTDREVALMKEAAVMGYVQGVMHPKGDRIPNNRQILTTVVDACFTFPDLYPAVDSVANPPEDAAP